MTATLPRRKKHLRLDEWRHNFLEYAPNASKSDWLQRVPPTLPFINISFSTFLAQKRHIRHANNILLITYGASLWQVLKAFSGVNELYSKHFEHCFTYFLRAFVNHQATTLVNTCFTYWAFLRALFQSLVNPIARRLIPLKQQASDNTLFSSLINCQWLL